MKTIWNILKKEMLNITRNRRRLFMMLLFNLILLPCLVMIPMWAVTRNTVQGAIQKLEVPVQGVEFAPELIAYIEKNESMTIVKAASVEKMVREKQAAAGLILPSDFEERLKKGEPVLVFVVMDKSKSFNLEGDRLKSITQKYSETILGERLKENNISKEYLTPIQVEELNTATEQETTGSQLSLLIPGFIMTFCLTSGLSIAISSIAGEKEEQTLEPVLFTPISRTQLVFGKMFAVVVNVTLSALGFLFIIAFSALIFFIAMAFSLRNMDLSSVPSTAVPIAASAGSSIPFASAVPSLPEPLALILFVASTIPIILLAAALQIMISSIARNSEEAYTYSLPLSVLSLLPLMVSFFLDEYVPELWNYAIPVFGTILSMRDLLSNHIYVDSLTVMFISSIGYAAMMVGASVWMFNREEVVFRA